MTSALSFQQLDLIKNHQKQNQTIVNKDSEWVQNLKM